MAKPETVRYEVTCQKQPVATYERAFDPAMQFTQGKESSFDPVGDAKFELGPYKERGRVTFKEMDGPCMIVHMQAYPLERAVFPIQAKVQCVASGTEESGRVIESMWSVPEKKYLYKLGADDVSNPISFSREWYPEDLLKLL